MADDLQTLVGTLSDHQFEELYGPLGKLTPGDAATLFDGIDASWWIVGGWAIEAFSGNQRDHEDLDIGILASDIPQLLDHFVESHHVWATGGGVMCPLLSATQELPPWMHQIWIREAATEPWLVDVIISPDQDGQWVFQRDQTHIADLSTVTWQSDDGIAYQKPEITLAFKAAHARPKDDADLESSLPLLTTAARDWLAETLARLHPGHRWLDRF